jgi:hypothetical protein
MAMAKVPAGLAKFMAGKKSANGAAKKGKGAATAAFQANKFKKGGGRKGQ